MRRACLVSPDDLEDRECPGIIVDSLKWLHGQGKIECLGYTVMPDHLHLVFPLTGNAVLSKVIESFSKFTARRLNTVMGRTGRFWQHGFYERMIRDDEELYNQLRYLHENPVRASFVKTPEDWPLSEVYPEWQAGSSWFDDSICGTRLQSGSGICGQSKLALEEADKENPVIGLPSLERGPQNRSRHKIKTNEQRRMDDQDCPDWRGRKHGHASLEFLEG
jgi:REP element-mobilizing transposase RayT